MRAGASPLGEDAARLRALFAPSNRPEWTRPKDQIRWITIEEYQVDFAGIISELDDWLDARCGNSAELAKQYDELGGQTAEVKAMRSAIGEKFKVRELCRIALKNKMREDAWRTYRGL
jgi:hypothetical protein